MKETCIRAGLLGAGYIAQAHLRALRLLPAVRVEAVCDLDETRARALAREWGISRVFTRAEEMAASGLDAVHVILPPAAHAEGAAIALDGGCHVFLEKPMGLSTAECRNIEAAARRNGKRLAVNHTFTFHPAFRKLTAAVRERRLGGLQHVTACMNIPLRQLAAGQHGHWMFRSPGNILLELGPHPLSQIEVLVGRALRVASMACGRTVLNTGGCFFDSWQLSLECERGTAQLFLSVGKEYCEHWVQAIGQDGSALADLRRNTLVAGGKSRYPDAADNLRHAWRAAGSIAGQGTRNFRDYVLGFLRVRPAADPFALSFAGAVRAFYEALGSGRPFPAGLGCGSSVIQTCERAIASAVPGFADGHREVIHVA